MLYVLNETEHHRKTSGNEKIININKDWYVGFQ